MKVLVTGGNGFIGRELCKQLYAQGHQVMALDLKEFLHPYESWLQFHWDLMDGIPPEEIWRHQDAIVHLAAPPWDPDLPADERFRQITYGHYIAMSMAYAASAPFLMASSAYVYGPPVLSPQDEDHPIMPGHNPYACVICPSEKKSA